VQRRIAVVVNRASGAGRVDRHVASVLTGLASRGDHVVAIEAESEQAARETLAEAMTRGLDVVVALGGDGTVHLALQAAVGTSAALGIVPLGTGNDAATSVGLARTSPEAAVSVILAGHTRTFDVGRVEAADGTIRHFLCVLTTGCDSSANERANMMSWPSGTGLYVRAMLAELRGFTPIPYTADFDGEVVRDEGMLVSLGNGPNFGGGMQVCAGADLHDGLLNLIWVHSLPRHKLLWLFPKVYTGRHLQHPQVESRLVARAVIDAPGQIAYADGERVAPLPVTVSAVPDAVRVLVPG
jgi:diacylglycerol kinase (ATP)